MLHTFRMTSASSKTIFKIPESPYTKNEKNGLKSGKIFQATSCMSSPPKNDVSRRMVIPIGSFLERGIKCVFQHFAEGVLWLVITKPRFAGLQAVVTSIFLIMAQILWPILVPLSVLFLERHKIRKRILIFLLVVGAAAASYSAYSLLLFPAHAEASFLHIAYINNNKDQFKLVATALYLIATLVPFFVSSVKNTKILGIVFGVSFIISAMFFYKIPGISVVLFFGCCQFHYFLYYSG